MVAAGPRAGWRRRSAACVAVRCHIPCSHTSTPACRAVRTGSTAQPSAQPPDSRAQQARPYRTGADMRDPQVLCKAAAGMAAGGQPRARARGSGTARCRGCRGPCPAPASRRAAGSACGAPARSSASSPAQACPPKSTGPPNAMHLIQHTETRCVACITASMPMPCSASCPARAASPAAAEQPELLRRLLIFYRLSCIGFG